MASSGSALLLIMVFILIFDPFGWFKGKTKSKKRSRNRKRKGSRK